VLLAKRSVDPADARLLELLDLDLADDALHAEALALLRAHPAMDQARDVTRRWAGEASAVLSQLPDSTGRTALELLADAVVERSA